MRRGKIAALYQRMPVDGDVGIEIEMEGVGLAGTQHEGMRKHGDAWPWAFKQDGSLRGESCEWVLYQPVNKAKVTETLAMLWAAKDKVGAEFNPSRRCGVHIHMNVQQLSEQQVWNLIGTYLFFENILVRWAGESREGNLFCLRASDAHELVDMLARVRLSGSFLPHMNDHVRYASVNINSIGRYGSLEFRALGTPADPQRIAQWVRMLYCIRDFSLEFKNLKDMLYKLSAADAKEFITGVFGPRSVLRHIEDADVLLREGMRNVQDMLVTTPNQMRNNVNLPPQGWHVFDPDGPQPRRAMYQPQKWYADDGVEMDEPQDPEPDWDAEEDEG